MFREIKIGLMRAIIKKTFQILLVTIALPFTLMMALGYWSENKSGISFWEAFKKVI